MNTTSELIQIPQLPDRGRKEADKKLQDRVVILMEKYNLSQGDIAEQIGISRSVLSEWLSGKYDHNSSLIPALRAWIARIQGGEQESPFIEFSNSQKVFSACEYAVSKRSIGLIIGHPGLGKTVALREWHRRAAAKDREVIYHVASPLTGHGSLAKMLARCSQLYENGTSHDLIESVIASLRRRPATLLFDESNHFNIKCLEVIRYIYDQVQIPIILCGSIQLIKTLSDGTRFAIELGQLHSRISFRIKLEPLSIKEISIFLSNHFASVSKEVTEEFHRGSKGIVRDLVNGIDHVKVIMAKNGLDEPTVESVKKAFGYQVIFGKA